MAAMNISSAIKMNTPYGVNYKQRCNGPPFDTLKKNPYL
jgi:hypothetical protein